MNCSAHSNPAGCARRLPEAGMVGPFALSDMVHQSSFAGRSSISSLCNSVAGKRDSDVRIQKRGILLQERGFMFQSGKGGARHV